MSEANGHSSAGTYNEVREQLRLTRAQIALRKAEAESRLWESFTAPQGGGWGSFVDPYDQFRDIDGRPWLPLGGRRDDRKDGHNRPFVWSEIDLEWSRGLARWLTTKNKLAIGAMLALRNFTIKTGFTYEAQPAKRLATDATAQALAEQVQDVIDEFSTINAWSEREKSQFWRSRRDGESFLRHFAQMDGTTFVRFVEPEQVVQPLGSPPTWSFGIHTDPHDIETVLSYAVTYGEPDDWEEVPAGEITHIKLNVDECVKRGLSDFFSTGEDFDGVSKLLRNMREAGAVQAAIAWIEQFDAAGVSGIQGHVATVRDQNRPQIENPITGKRVDYQKFEPGTIVKVGKGRSYLNAPLANNTTQHVAIAQSCLRALGCRWNMPEYMISGDASNANYSSTLVAGSPFVNAIECEQSAYKRPFLRSQWIAVRNAAAAGRFVVNGRRFTVAEIMRYVDIHATAPQVAVANEAEQTDTDHKDIAAGVMSIQTRRARRGLDDAKERQNLAEEPPTRIAGRVTDVDAQGNPVAGPAAGAGSGLQTSGGNM
jgi:hypothetical protein